MKSWYWMMLYFTIRHHLLPFCQTGEDFSADLTDAMREMRRILEGGEEDA